MIVRQVAVREYEIGEGEIVREELMKTGTLCSTALNWFQILAKAFRCGYKYQYPR
jgi:hypothetical protein